MSFSVFKILIMGPQGSGKGTQAEILAKDLGIPAVSAGSLLREEIAKGTDLGRQVAADTESGRLVPDQIMIEIIKNRLKQPDMVKGWILDGFPRILSQAELLLQFVQPSHAILIDLSDEQAVERLAGRVECLQCRATYHLKHAPPRDPAHCDACGGELRARSDDTPGLIRQRLKIFHDETEPVVKKFEEMGILRRVNGSGTIEEVAAAVKTAICL